MINQPAVLFTLIREKYTKRWKKVKKDKKSLFADYRIENTGRFLAVISEGEMIIFLRKRGSRFWLRFYAGLELGFLFARAVAKFIIKSSFSPDC
jgi:hypothetical protein